MTKLSYGLIFLYSFNILSTNPHLIIDIPATSVPACYSSNLDRDPDDISVIDEEKLVEFALNLYFKRHKKCYSKIVPELKRKIKEAAESPSKNEREAVEALKFMMQGNSLDDDHYKLKCLYELILNISSESLKKIEKDYDKYKKLSKKRVNKQTLITTNVANTCITGLLGLASTLVIHFTSKC